MITPIIKKEDLFSGYSDILLIGIYTDKISAIVVRKEKDAMRAVAAVTELQESGELAAEKIRLNSEKALQKLPAEILAGVKNFVCILGGGVSEFQLTVENKIRSEKDQKISEQEIAVFALKNRINSVNIEETFLVDGFAVENPIGMDGKEITARILSVGWSEDFEKTMFEVATARGMRYLGVLDARLVLIKSAAPDLKDYCAVFIFEKNITICIIRGGSVSATSNVDGGYGIITEEVARRMSVGQEEAKNILNDFKNNKLDGAVAEAIKEIVAQNALEIKNKIYSGLAAADKTNLLPGAVRIVVSDWNYELKKILSGTDWLVGLPIERNISVVVEIQENEESICPFDCAVLNYLTIFDKK